VPDAVKPNRDHPPLGMPSKCGPLAGKRNAGVSSAVPSVSNSPLEEGMGARAYRSCEGEVFGHEQPDLWGIISPWMPGMAAADPKYPAKSPPNGSILPHRQDEVHAARRLEPAVAAQDGAQGPSVEVDHSDQQPGRQSHDPSRHGPEDLEPPGFLLVRTIHESPPSSSPRGLPTASATAWSGRVRAFRLAAE